MDSITKDVLERFWNKVNKHGGVSASCPELGECWLWTASCAKKGYGQFRLPKRKHITAHRMSYEINIGPIPNGLLVCHRCDVPICVNPNHLFLGTNKDNVADMDKKGRRTDLRGELNPLAKLTEEKVREIRYFYAHNNIIYKDLGRLYGISRAQACGIVLRKFWKHVE